MLLLCWLKLVFLIGYISGFAGVNISYELACRINGCLSSELMITSWIGLSVLVYCRSFDNPGYW
jgi:hypothetical protein